MKDWIYSVKRLVISDQVAEWCKLSYDGHPKGCPNFGKSKRCPPMAPMVGDVFDISQGLWLVHSEFNLANHILKMEKRHPEWSLKQCKCVLYWQSTSRKQLKERVYEAFIYTGSNIFAMVPEAMGVNVYATASVSGLKLERIRHIGICRHVALIGHGVRGQLKLKL